MESRFIGGERGRERFIDYALRERERGARSWKSRARKRLDSFKSAGKKLIESMRGKKGC